MLLERMLGRVHMPDHPGVRVVAPLLFLGALLLGFAFHLILPLPLAHEGAVIVIATVGAALFVIGGVLIATALRRFRASRTSPLPLRPTTALVMNGPFRYTRNPMYLGMLLVCAGIALVANALWPLVLLPVVIVLVNNEVIVREEKYLSRKFGGEYEVYKRRTRRWI